jgi:methyl-accepting chemotaxis protein
MNIALLRESFDLIIPQKEAFAHSFYERLFTDYPQTQALFAHTNMEKQEDALVATLAVVVAGVERGDNLVPALRTLGEKHHHYGAVEAHYPVVGSVLLETLSEYLGPKFTPEVKETWSQAFAVISGQMVEGAKQRAL